MRSSKGPDIQQDGTRTLRNSSLGIISTNVYRDMETEKLHVFYFELTPLKQPGSFNLTKRTNGMYTTGYYGVALNVTGFNIVMYFCRNQTSVTKTGIVNLIILYYQITNFRNFSYLIEELSLLCREKYPVNGAAIDFVKQVAMANGLIESFDYVHVAPSSN